MKSIHFNGSEETIELILRTIELSKDSGVAVKIAANEDLESMEIPTELRISDPHTNAELWETCCKIMSVNVNKF